MQRLHLGPNHKTSDAVEAALTDPLTGLGNARRFHAKIARLIAERADDPAPFAVAILDLDGFKPINDLFGRATGDVILTQIAMRLHASIEAGSSVARIGADEFAFLFPLVFTEEAVEARMRTLIEVISAPYDLGERMARLSATAGCAVFEFGDETADGLVSKAESALYLAKKSARGKALVYTAQMEENARWITRIEQALRRAIAAGEIQPFFQPIVDIDSRRTLGFEMLARWTDPELGPIAPDLFIPIAEERGIIGQMSQLLLRKAAASLKLWPEHLALAVNLSPSQLVDQNTGLHIMGILDRAGIDPRRIEVELTESGVMTDPASAEKIIGDLRLLGVKISLDDFGTGQSSLGRLRALRFDKLKIDRSFIASVLDDKPSEHIVRAIVAMCEGLGMQTVAEGIETEAQAVRLGELGCRMGQGYLFGRPADASATLRLIQAEFAAGRLARA